jgi:fibro-slime domain-containing protein
MTIRDFDQSHPDFERPDPGWGPSLGIVQSTLGTDKKPVFKSAAGDCQILQDEAEKQAYTYTKHPDCWVDTGKPMLTDANSFNDWYRDSDRNMQFKKLLALKELGGSPGTYYFESLEEPFQNFFPLAENQGFGPTPVNESTNPMHQNFLFTTEIHLLFEYVQGQVFKFSGDDDLWIFVNGKLALDLGGLHSRFNAAINFDAQAAALGIVAGQSYNMDIFHAERHTKESNFRIETNISCFTPVPIV